MISAVALGAVGAVAAASAVVIGLTSSDHSAQALDSPPADPLVSTGSGAGGAAVAMSPSAGPSVPISDVTARPTPGLTGSVITTRPSQPGSAPNGGAAADLSVSVPQRSADPGSVTILLRDIGTGPVTWSATPENSWITLSQSAGTIPPGGSLTITADATGSAPSGQWTTQVSFAPGNQVLVLHGGAPATTASAPPTGPSSAPPSTGGDPTAPPTTDPPATAPPTQPPTSAPPASATGTPTTPAKPTSPPRRKR